MQDLKDRFLLRYEQLNAEFELLKSWGFQDLNFDAQFKWANIIHEFHKHFGSMPHNLKILDLGGGLGPLDMYFSKFGDTINIDKNFSSTWFPTNTEGYLEGSLLRENPNRLERIAGDIFDLLPGNFGNFDFIYDSCSIIHFKNPNQMSRNQSLNLVKVFKLINSLCSEDTFFISATDLAHKNIFEIGDFVFENKFLSAANAAGFKEKIVIGQNDYKMKYKNCKIQRNNFTGLEFNSDYLNLLNIESFLTTKFPVNTPFSPRIIVGVYVFQKTKFKNFAITPLLKVYKVRSFLFRFFYKLYSIVYVSFLKVKI